MPLEASDIKVVSGEEADSNCPVQRGFVGTPCEVCDLRVIVHCPDCMQHMTHCNCTFDEMKRRHKEAAQIQDEQRSVEDRLRGSGVWVPGQ